MMHHDARRVMPVERVGTVSVTSAAPARPKLESRPDRLPNPNHHTHSSPVTM